MLLPPHRACFERPGEARCGSVLSTGVYGCSWFSFGFAVNVFLGMVQTHLTLSIPGSFYKYQEGVLPS